MIDGGNRFIFETEADFPDPNVSGKIEVGDGGGEYCFVNGSDFCESLNSSQAMLLGKHVGCWPRKPGFSVLVLLFT